jgi:hypothetical protein
MPGPSENFTIPYAGRIKDSDIPVDLGTGIIFKGSADLKSEF